MEGLRQQTAMQGGVFSIGQIGMLVYMTSSTFLPEMSWRLHAIFQ